jgi:hypothetical protein
VIGPEFNDFCSVTPFHSKVEPVGSVRTQRSPVNWRLIKSAQCSFSY